MSMEEYINSFYGDKAADRYSSRIKELVQC